MSESQDESIHLPFGLNSKKITGLLTAAVIVLMVGYYFKDDISAGFDVKQANKSAVLRSSDNQAAIKSLKAEHAKLIAEMSRKISALEARARNDATLIKTDIASLTQSSKQAKIERDRNTLFAAEQPARGQRRTERLDGLRRDVNRNERRIEGLSAQHSIPGKHPIPEH